MTVLQMFFQSWLPMIGIVFMFGFAGYVIGYMGLLLYFVGRMDPELIDILKSAGGTLLGVVMALVLLPEPIHVFLVSNILWVWGIWMLLAIGGSFFAGDRTADYIVKLKGERGEAMVSKYLAKKKWEHLDDLYVTRGDWVSQVDHVVKAGNSIVVIETKNYTSAVFGSVVDPNWTFGEKNGRQDYNPLRQNEGHVAAVNHVATGNVVGVVVVPDYTLFPKGVPIGVVPLRKLDDFLHAIAEQEAPAGAWERLKAYCAGSDKETLNVRHRRQLARMNAAPAPQLVKKPKNCWSCKGSSLAPAHARNWYWKCDDCGRGTPMTLPEGSDIVVEGDVFRVTASDGTVLTTLYGSKVPEKHEEPTSGNPNPRHPFRRIGQKRPDNLG